MQRYYASLPGWVKEMVDEADWSYWRLQVSRYQYAHRPHRSPEDD